MFEKFTTANAGDFRQRYEGTFGFYRGEDGKRLLTKLQYIRADVCSFVDSRGVEYKLFPNTEKNIGFEFIPPKAAYHNTPTGAKLVQRVAARQFQRGLSAKNTLIYWLKEGLLQCNVSFAELDSIFMKAVDAQTAFKNFDNLPSVALSGQVALSKQGDVYMYEKKIGTFTKTGPRVVAKLESPSLWRTEVMDSIRAAGGVAEVS